MSLTKAIERGKEKRKPYRGSKRFDPHCRNNNLCSWCVNNRTRFDRIARLRIEDDYDLIAAQGLRAADVAYLKAHERKMFEKDD